MSDHMPTVENLRETYAYIQAGLDHDDGHPFVMQIHVEAFDRWLAAHDAEVRAGVVAEEADTAEEWIAYGRGVSEEFMLPEPKGPRYATHQRTVKAGPWVPVKQEGESNE